MDDGRRSLIQPGVLTSTMDEWRLASCVHLAARKASSSVAMLSSLLGRLGRLGQSEAPHVWIGAHACVRLLSACSVGPRFPLGRPAWEAIRAAGHTPANLRRLHDLDVGFLHHLLGLFHGLVGQASRCIFDHVGGEPVFGCMERREEDAAVEREAAYVDVCDARVSQFYARGGGDKGALHSGRVGGCGGEGQRRDWRLRLDWASAGAMR